MLRNPLSWVLLLAAAARLAAAEASRGEALFRQSCALCHAAGPGMAGGQGPSLVALIGRKAGSLKGFGYTPALAGSPLVWDPATLERFLANPTGLVPGTNMVIAVPNAQDRGDLIAYLETVRAATVVAGSHRAVAPDPAASDDRDWRHQHPGVKYQLSVEALPAPYSSPSRLNHPMVVPPPTGAVPEVPPGFKVARFAQGLNGPRIIRVAPNGDLFVAETRANRLRVFRARDGAESPDTEQVFAEGLDQPFGLAFYPAGPDPHWLYVANNNSVVRLPYRNGDLVAQGRAETIVPQLTLTTSGHTTRDLVFSADGKILYLSVGSGSNAAEGLARRSPDAVRDWEASSARGAAWDNETHRADILVTDPEGKAPLRVFAAGIRNPVGLALSPDGRDLWTTVNERDGLGDDLVPDYVTRVRPGQFYGWPWYYMGNREDPRHVGERPDLKGRVATPDVLIQSHSAALGLAFYPARSGPVAFPAEYQGDLFVALHGSWNRDSRTGYKIIRVRLRQGVPTGGYEDFVTGFVADANGVWGRPVGVAVAHDGALLFSEDGNSTLWRVSPR